MTENARAFIQLVMEQPNPYDNEIDMREMGLTDAEEEEVRMTFDGYGFRDMLIRLRGAAEAQRLFLARRR